MCRGKNHKPSPRRCNKLKAARTRKITTVAMKLFGGTSQESRDLAAKLVDSGIVARMASDRAAAAQSTVDRDVMLAAAQDKSLRVRQALTQNAAAMADSEIVEALKAGVPDGRGGFEAPDDRVLEAIADPSAPLRTRRRQVRTKPRTRKAGTSKPSTGNTATSAFSRAVDVYENQIMGKFGAVKRWSDEIVMSIARKLNESPTLVEVLDSEESARLWAAFTPEQEKRALERHGKDPDIMRQAVLSKTREVRVSFITKGASPEQLLTLAYMNDPKVQPHAFMGLFVRGFITDPRVDIARARREIAALRFSSFGR